MDHCAPLYMDRGLLCVCTAYASQPFGPEPVSAASNYKVSVLGASGGIGQPLALLLKNHPAITHLTLYVRQISHVLSTEAIYTEANGHGHSEKKNLISFSLPSPT